MRTKIKGRPKPITPKAGITRGKYAMGGKLKKCGKKSKKC
jgi:hypothetical protein